MSRPLLDHSARFSGTELWFGRGLAAVILAIIPLVYDQSYFLHIVSLAMIAAIAALGQQLLMGFSGQLSMGQAAFLGIGAYTSGILSKQFHVPFTLAFLAAGFFAAISSLILVPITRLRGAYLSVATLGFTIIVYLVLLNEDWLTGGAFGLLGIPWASIGPLSLKGDRRTYFLCLIVMWLVYLAFRRIVKSRFGRALQAVMLDEDAAKASGINVTIVKSKCFIVAAAVTGLAGSLFAHNARYLNPNDFTFWKSIEIVIMVAVGGVGSLSGAIVGAFTVVLMPEALRAVEQWRLVIFGTVVIVLMGIGKGGLSSLFGIVISRALKAVRRAGELASIMRRAAP